MCKIGENYLIGHYLLFVFGKYTTRLKMGLHGCVGEYFISVLYSKLIHMKCSESCFTANAGGGLKTESFHLK